VLKSLTEEGYLEGRRGIGTFTLPQNFIPGEGNMPPLIGLLAGDGKYFYYPYQVWGIMASCGLVLTRGGCNVRPLNLIGADDETRFAEISRQYLDGLIVLDIPPEEAGQLAAACAREGLALVFFLAPTSSAARIALVGQHTTGFIYVVSIAGVTGARTQLPPDLTGFIARVRAQTDQPLVLGFGISQPEQARLMNGLVEGFIVGSALVKAGGTGGDAVRDLAATLRRALDGA